MLGCEGWGGLDGGCESLGVSYCISVRIEGMSTVMCNWVRVRVLESPNILPSSSCMQFTPEGSSTINWVFSKNGCRL